MAALQGDGAGDEQSAKEKAKHAKAAAAKEEEAAQRKVKHRPPVTH